MPQEIEVRLGMETIGNIVFDEAPSQFIASRTASGFSLTIPAYLNLRPNTEGKQVVLITNARAIIFVKKDSQTEIQVGIAEDPTWHLSGGRDHLNLVWTDGMTALACVEKCRNGERPQIRLEFRAEVCWLLKHHQAEVLVRTRPEYIGGRVSLTYPKEVWLKMLKDIHASENILLEMPIPTNPPTEWDKVWSGFKEAKSALEQGSWKTCVSAVRLALEEWRAIEKEDMGAGWVSASANDLKSRTKRQRYDNLRWHLIQCAHLGPHTGAEDWSRGDALLMLSTFSSLLAERRP